MWMSMIHPAAELKGIKGKEASLAVVWMTAKSPVESERHRLLWQPFLTPSSLLTPKRPYRQETIEDSLLVCLLRADGFLCGWRMNDSVFFTGLSTESLSMLQWVYVHHNWTQYLLLLLHFLFLLFILLLLLLLFKGGHRVGDEPEVNVIRVHYMEFANNQ